MRVFKSDSGKYPEKNGYVFITPADGSHAGIPEPGDEINYMKVLEVFELPDLHRKFFDDSIRFAIVKVCYTPAEVERHMLENDPFLFPVYFQKA